MRSNLGEEGTEQFSIATRVNGKLIADQKIHDPFIRTTVRLRGLRHAWNALFGGIEVWVAVDGTHGANRAVMTLDPRELMSNTEDFLASCHESRSQSGVMGFYSDSKAVN